MNTIVNHTCSLFIFQWLKSIVSLQCDIAKHLSSLSVPKDGVKKTVKAVISGSTNHVISNNKTSNQTTTNCSNSSEAKTTKSLTVNSTSSTTTSSVKTVTTTKPNTLTAKVVSSPTTNTTQTSTVTSFSRVVTTHTVTSGGKTLTKPITILYASPSKNLTQQNGVNSNVTKHLNNCVKKVANDTKPVAKVEGNVKKATLQQNSAKMTLQTPNNKNAVAQNTHMKSPTVQTSKQNSMQSPKNATLPTSTVNSVKTMVKGDLKTLSKGPVVKPRTIGEPTKAVSVSPPGTNTSRTMNVVGTVSTALNSGSGSGTTKVIVLTNTGNGNIIKNIASTSLSTSTQRTVGSSGTTTAVTSPSVQRIVVQPSPQKGMVNGGGLSSAPGATPTSQAASPVSTICAVSGLDSIQGKLLGVAVVCVLAGRTCTVMAGFAAYPPVSGWSITLHTSDLKDKVIVSFQNLN